MLQTELERAFNKLMAVRQLADSRWREVCERWQISLSTLHYWKRTHERIGFRGWLSCRYRQPPAIRVYGTKTTDRVKEPAIKTGAGASKIQKMLHYERINVTVRTVSYHLNDLELHSKQRRSAAYRKSLKEGKRLI